MYRLPIIFAVVMITLIAGILLIFGGHKAPKTTTSTAGNAALVLKPLPDYANTDAVTTLTVDGHINGDDAHSQIRITVSQNKRELDIIQGYSGTVVSSQSYYNTEDAYNVFLRSIYLSGFTLKSKVKPAAPTSELGQCATGFRYIFDVSQDNNDLSRLWTSSCGTGTFGGNSDLIQNLFQGQIPNYQQTANAVQL
jgi:hypothetical protein